MLKLIVAAVLWTAGPCIALGETAPPRFHEMLQQFALTAVPEGRIELSYTNIQAKRGEISAPEVFGFPREAIAFSTAVGPFWSDSFNGDLAGFESDFGMPIVSVSAHLALYDFTMPMNIFALAVPAPDTFAPTQIAKGYTSGEDELAALFSFETDAGAVPQPRDDVFGRGRSADAYLMLQPTRLIHTASRDQVAAFLDPTAIQLAQAPQVAPAVTAIRIFEDEVEAAVSIRLWARLEEQQSPVAWIAMLALPRLNGQERAAIIVPVHTGATPSEVAASMHERFQTVPSQYGPTLADVLADSRDVVFAPAPGGVDAVVIAMSGAANTSPALEADNWVYFDAIAHARNGDLELLLID